MNDSSNELLPCPFCQNKPYTHECEEMADDSHKLEAICLYYGCALEGIGLPIDAWNVRAKPEAVSAARGELVYSEQGEYFRIVGMLQDRIRKTTEYMRRNGHASKALITVTEKVLFESNDKLKKLLESIESRNKAALSPVSLKEKP